MVVLNHNDLEDLPCNQNQNFQTKKMDRPLVIVSNRGPVTLQRGTDNEIHYQKGSGGLVTALIGLAQNIRTTWIASALTDLEKSWKEGIIPLENSEKSIKVELIDIPSEAYDLYYNVISNPLLWFLQHSMWDFVRSPTITKDTFRAWETGYVSVNRIFAQAIAREIKTSHTQPIVMLQDYHLYLVPAFLRKLVSYRHHYTLTHFVHIPWPGSEDWGFLPSEIRKSILQSLCAVDMIGFQTREDSLNFIRTCESHLPETRVNFRRGRVVYRNHVTHVRDFPISIDIQALRILSESSEVNENRHKFMGLVGDKKLVVRVDRTEPSKNIVRGFEAFGEMFELYPEHLEGVIFLAILVPSRLEVQEYQAYLDEIMAAAGRVNARFGSSDWEPIRVLVGEDYYRAIAALQLYDVLLVNAIADGMNLVAKEGPVVNRKNGVLVLSERAGAHQQLGAGSIVISPCDIYSTSQAMHQGLIMDETERQRRSKILVDSIENDDIRDWFCRQMGTLAELNL
jgi:trehalose 6-phosphate synthase